MPEGVDDNFTSIQLVGDDVPVVATPTPATPSPAAALEEKLASIRPVDDDMLRDSIADLADYVEAEYEMLLK